MIVCVSVSLSPHSAVCTPTTDVQLYHSLSISHRGKKTPLNLVERAQLAFITMTNDSAVDQLH